MSEPVVPDLSQREVNASYVQPVGHVFRVPVLPVGQQHLKEVFAMQLALDWHKVNAALPVFGNIEKIIVPKTMR